MISSLQKFGFLDKQRNAAVFKYSARGVIEERGKQKVSLWGPVSCLDVSKKTNSKFCLVFSDPSQSVQQVPIPWDRNKLKLERKSE